MKIIHLNTYDGHGIGGAAVLRLNKSLKQLGANSVAICLHKFDAQPNVKAISGTILGRVKATLSTFAERYLSKALVKRTKIGFSAQRFGCAVVQNPLIKNADVIHIHWINDGFLSPKFLAQLDELEKPIVWTFYDSSAFTGGCHDHQGCEHYHKECGLCPMLKISGKNDFSHQTWLRKKKAYSELNCHIVASDNLIAGAVKLSSLMGFREVTMIPNSIATNVFKPYLKTEAKKVLKISPDKFVVMIGSMSFQDDIFSDRSYLMEALNDLASRPGLDKGEIELVVLRNKTNVEFPFKTTFLGEISNDEHLAKCYSAADIFLVSSVTEQLPNGVIESLSCATPVVAFKKGEVQQMIKHLENGYLAECGSTEDLATGVEWLYHDENTPDIQKEARRMILTEFSEPVIAEKHLLLYQSLIDLQPK
ncbi:MAG: glycosyltransferase [Candidatus Pedobacter colombiensis]|uniref:Glycosyltransferase n=1 Tax=Candidatus Pedobacter colombiensis TaxID=3121371 RepID=A0AAJ5W9Q3_9SPHI|nr:glycosyltransferase [Pedobacter sp.]WEK19604.1 MAG: glycosyltransferase [Pedobacter sp.]